MVHLHDEVRAAVARGELDARVVKGMGQSRRGREDLFDEHLPSMLSAFVRLRVNGGSIEDEEKVRKRLR